MSARMDKRKVWIVEPHAESDFSECWLPAETEQDHERALEYAQDRLESLWNGLTVGDQPATVTIKLAEVDEQAYQAVQKQEPE